MSQTLDLTGNALKVDSVTGSNSTATPAFSAATASAPGTKAGTPAAFDKAMKITVSGVNYWVGLYSDNS